MEIGQKRNANRSYRIDDIIRRSIDHGPHRLASLVLSLHKLLKKSRLGLGPSFRLGVCELLRKPQSNHPLWAVHGKSGQFVLGDAL